MLMRVTFNAQKSYVVMSGKGKPPTLQTWKLGKEKIPFSVHDKQYNLGINQGT